MGSNHLGIIDGKYQILKNLGEGFGGSVYLVECEGKRVALKQLKMRSDLQYFSAQDILSGFKQEFSTLAKLNHPHILRILDFGFDAQKNFYYFTTEYIPGKTILEATQGLTPLQIEELFVQTLRALSYLHNQRVYHLDIKPNNLLVEEGSQNEKTAKLIDFGIAAFKKKGIFAGSPLYVAPEAILQDPCDGRTDLYSLGVTWYECLARKNPFASGSLLETLDLQKKWIPPPISQAATNVPRYLDVVLEKLLKKNPAERYHHADQVIRDLNWGGGRNYPLETEATALAYLPGEGKLVEREEEWSKIISLFEKIFISRKKLKGHIVISGAPGTGKSRLLRELKYHAQLQAVPVFEENDFYKIDVKSDCLLLIDNIHDKTMNAAERWMQLFHPYSILLITSGTDLKNNNVSDIFISLKNFKYDSVKKYISSILGVEEDPPAFLVEELYSRTEGNPLFLTDLLDSLIRSHQIFDAQGKWSPLMLKEIKVDFRKLQVPKTLQEYCQSKFKNLPNQAQQLLSIIALSKIPLDNLLLMKMGIDFNKDDLKILEKNNLVRVDPAKGEIRLNNPNFLDWIPENLSPGLLAHLHETLGKLFSSDPNTRFVAGYHLGLGLGSYQERLQHLWDYGESLLDQGSWLEAASALDQALALAVKPEDQVNTLLKKARALFRAGRHSDALLLLEKGQQILKNEKGNPKQWHWVQQTYREMGSIYLKARKFDLAHDALQASRILLEEHGEDPTEEIILENLRASLLMREGKLNDAETIFEKNYEQWKSLPLENRKRILNNELGSIYLAKGELEKSKNYFSAMTSFCSEISDLNRKVFATYGCAESCLLLNDLEGALPLYQSCVELSRILKNEELLFHAFNGLGNIAFSQKNWALAAQHYQNALELAQHSADVDSSIGIAINLAHVLRLQKDYTSSGLYLRHVLDTLEGKTSPSLHQIQFLIQGYLELGRLYLEKGCWLEARDGYRDAVRLVKYNSPLNRFRFLAYAGLAEAEFELGRNQEANNILMELEEGKISSAEKKELEELRNSFVNV
jgi:tetratricopeptide (TPR) repeat protein